MPLLHLPPLQSLKRLHRPQTLAVIGYRSSTALVASLLAVAGLYPTAHSVAQQTPQAPSQAAPQASGVAPAPSPAPVVPNTTPGAQAASSPGGSAQAPTSSASPANRPVAVPGAPCLIAEFRTLALDTHDPTERERVVRQWLRRNLPGCSLEKLTLMGSNRAAWLGTADSATIMGKIDTAIEARVQDNPALLAQLFDALPRTFIPGVETIRTEPARPIVGSQGGQGFVGSVGVIGVRPMDGQAPPYPSPGGSPWLEPPTPIRPTR